ncbi:MAG TPA: hypothetical protein VKS79_21805 [Gemmataceae bacterium]|nr:hypothetical protein [Gemmataceae bacterium]
MQTTRNWLRAGILVATLLPLVMVGLIAGFSKAQPPGNMPRGPGMPGGNFPKMPNNPGGPPGFPGNMPGNTPNMPSSPPSMPNMPGPPETVWTCSNCGKEVGRGPFKPDIANCPFCGVRIGNTVAGMEANAQDRMNQAQNRTPSPPPPFASGPASSSGSSRSAAPRVAAAFWIVAVIVGFVIVVIIAVAIVGAVMLFNSTPKPRRASRARRYRDDY